jgi:hypothetical protein
VEVSLSVCILSREEAGQLHWWGIWPHCKRHHHCSKATALEGAKQGLFEFVLDKDDQPTSMITPSRIGMWAPVACCDESGKPLMGARVWGLAKAR